MRRASTTHFQPTRIALAAITKAGDNFLHESRDLASADHQLEQFSRLLYLGAQHPPQRRRLEQWFEQQLASPTVAQNEFQRQFLQFGHEVLQQFTDVAGHKSFAPVPQNARQRRNEQAPAQFALKLANSVWQASAALQSGNVTLAEKSLNKLAAEIPTQPLWLNLRGWWHIARGKLHYAQGEMPAAGEQLA